MKRRRSLSAVLAAVLSVMGATGAIAQAQTQTWPTSPVHIIVSSGAGGTADILARLIGEHLARSLKQPVVIEDKPGAGGNLGAAMVARAKPDGYTLLMSGAPTHSVGPHLYKNLGYEPMRDVPPLAMVAAGPNLLVVNASLPVKSLQDLIKLGRERKLNYSSAGVGTSGHLAAALLKRSTGMDARHVPYKSGPEAVTGVLSGQIDFIFFTVPSLLPQVEAGQLRALAITSATRSALVPNVPTVAELGFPDFEVLAWYALFTPRDTPPDIVAKLTSGVQKAVDAPELREKMLKLGVEPKYMDPAQLTAYVAAESPKLGKLIQDSGITAQ